MVTPWAVELVDWMDGGDTNLRTVRGKCAKSVCVGGERSESP